MPANGAGELLAGGHFLGDRGVVLIRVAFVPVCIRHERYKPCCGTCSF